MTVRAFVLTCTWVLAFAISTLAVSAGDSTSPPVAIQWKVNVDTKSAKKRSLLKDVIGSAGRGKLHALIGPSGSGKTTLLNILAGFTPKGALSVEGIVSSSYEEQPVYVQQEDLLFSQLTVEETLETSIALRSVSSTRSERRAIANRLILDLGLKKAMHTRVGDSKTRGISGGEKKRLSIGNELALGSDANVRLIFADEPTSGLDSYQAQNVVSLLKKLAEKGNTVITSIHQPRSSVCALFDEVTLLSEGQVMYSGPAAGIVKYFQSLGYSVPANTNPIEHFVDLISIDYSSKEEELNSRDRIDQLATAFRDRHPEEAFQIKLPMMKSPGSISGSQLKSTGPFGKLRKTIRNFGTLFLRAWRQVTRDFPLNFARLMSSLFVSLLYGAIYNKLGLGASTVPDRLGLLQIAAVSTAMTTVVKATTSFVSERLIVNRERRSGAYSTASYLISKLVAELPLNILFPCLSGTIMYKLCGLNPGEWKFLHFLKILTVESIAASSIGMAVGSFAPSVDSAVAISPSIMVIFIVFGGLFVVNTPTYFKWMPKASLIKWAYEALCINEFEGLKLKPEAPRGPLAVSDGMQVLESLGFKDSTIDNALKGLGIIIVANYAFTYLSLLLQKPSSESLKPFGEASVAASGSSSKVTSDMTVTATIHERIKSDETHSKAPKVPLRP